MYFIRSIRKTFTVSVLTLFIGGSLFAQQVKYNSVIAKLVDDPSNAETLPVLIKGEVDGIKQAVVSLGGFVKYHAGDIVAVVVPVKQLKELSLNPSVVRMEGNDQRLKMLNDSVRVHNNVNEVHSGMSPLPQGYDGKDVVMGIIDSGLDFMHPDFRDSVGGQSVTRVKYLWDQNLSTGGTTPQPYNYGQEWNNLEIDSGNAVGHVDNSGHGTHVTGVAAGNGKGANVNKGVAPATDLVIVETNFANPTGFMVSDAVNYIFSKADSLNKPCVINISLGDYYGSHDGNDLQAQLVKNLLTQKNGRSIVAAAGNLGNIPFHLGYSVTSDTNFTWFTPDPSISGKIYIRAWGDTANMKNVNFSVGADRVSPSLQFKGNIDFFKVTDNPGVLINDTLRSGGDRIGTLLMYSDVIGDAYSLEIEITPDSAAFNWRLMATGSGWFDVWNLNFSNYQPGMVTSGIPSAASFPDSIYYKYPDKSQTIVSGLQCLDEVITVGNYVNRNTHLNCDSNIYTDPALNPGTIADNSSRGPSRDGKIKPDVASTGNYTMAAGPLWLMAAVSGGAACTTHVSHGDLHFRDGGTSNASPAVAGIAALYLQRYPTASYSDIKDAIIYCAKQDVYTGAFLPNNTWGYGKANAFAALQNCYVGTNNIASRRLATIKVFPNPFQNQTQFDYVFDKSAIDNGVRFNVYNALGEVVYSKAINNEQGSFTFNREENAAGFYHYSFSTATQMLTSGKLIVY